MLMVGKYGIAFKPVLPGSSPDKRSTLRIHKFLFFRFIKVVNAEDIDVTVFDKSPKYVPGSTIVRSDGPHRYVKFGKK